MIIITITHKILEKNLYTLNFEPIDCYRFLVRIAFCIAHTNNIAALVVHDKRAVSKYTNNR